MKTPGFEWEPEPRRRRHVTRRMPVRRTLAAIGIGLGVLIIYSFCMIMLIDQLVTGLRDALPIPLIK